jgi:hypothetical protein
MARFRRAMSSSVKAMQVAFMGLLSLHAVKVARSEVRVAIFLDMRTIYAQHRGESRFILRFFCVRSGAGWVRGIYARKIFLGDRLK